MLVLSLLLMASSFAYNRSQAASGGGLADLPQLSLQDVHSLLVISPHPDDETIGAAGLIQMVHQKGDEVLLREGGVDRTPSTL